MHVGSTGARRFVGCSTADLVVNCPRRGRRLLSQDSWTTISTVRAARGRQGLTEKFTSSFDCNLLHFPHRAAAPEIALSQLMQAPSRPHLIGSNNERFVRSSPDVTCKGDASVAFRETYAHTCQKASSPASQVRPASSRPGDVGGASPNETEKALQRKQGQPLSPHLSGNIASELTDAVRHRYIRCVNAGLFLQRVAW